MEEHVYPNEEALNREDDAAQELLTGRGSGRRIFHRRPAALGRDSSHMRT